MQPKDAAESLNAMAEKLSDDSEYMPTETVFERLKKESVVDICSEISAIKVVLCSDMGTDQQSIIATTVGSLAMEKGGRMNCLVFPASTSDVEEKALTRWFKEG